MAYRRQERFINSLDFQFLTNTIELDLSHIFGKGMFPNKRDINTFITEEMKVTAAMLRGVQHHPRFPKVHVQFERQEDMQAVENRVKDGLVMKSKGIKIYGYRCDSPMVTIILNGQDMDLEEVEIKRVLGKYGTVVTCERGRNNDLSTEDKFVTDGTWTVRMTPLPRSKPPETIYYFGQSGQVQTWILNYDGVGSSCVLCGLIGHMGFRCNSNVPRSGLGTQPAGLGKWTDIATFEPVVVPGEQVGDVPDVLPDERVDGQVGDVPAGVGAAPVAVPVVPIPGQPAAQVGAGVGQPGGNAGIVGGNGERMVASQGDARKLIKMKALDIHTRQNGWGNPVANRAAPEAAQSTVKVNTPVGLDKNDQEQWMTKQKKKRKRKNKKNEKPEVKTNNMFEPLINESDINEDEDDDNIEEVKTKHKPVKFIARSNMGARYGSKRRVALVELYQESKKRHGSASEARIMKKFKKTSAGDKGDNGVEQHEAEHGLVKPASVPPGDGVVSESGMDLETDLLLKSGENCSADESVNLLATQGSAGSTLDGGGYAQQLIGSLGGSVSLGVGGAMGEFGLLGNSVKFVKQSDDMSSQSTVSKEDLEIKLKAEKIKAQLALDMKNVNTSSQQSQNAL